ncbi:MAG: TrbC/VirB2 family protein [Treponema sp.]|nr:TrbC/VirB2 family protein [Treponema sp.]
MKHKTKHVFLGMNKKMFITVLLMVLCSAFTFADSNAAATGMTSSVNNIVNFFGNGWVKGIACIMLIGECLGLLVAGGQNPQIFKKFLPFIIGTVLFMCAGKIVTLVFGNSTINFSSDLGTTTSN